MSLHYLIGDATNPISKSTIIAHVCNDCRPGRWGAGFVVALSRKDTRPEQFYKEWATKGELHNVKYELGNVQTAPFVDDIIVANMICQHDTQYEGRTPPIRYWAVDKALRKLFKYAEEKKLSVSMPRIGSKLAGGLWEEIEYIIKNTMGSVEVYVYTLPSEKNDWPNDPYEN